MDSIVYPFGQATISVPSGSKIAVFTRGTAQVVQQVGYPNEPTKNSALATVSAGSYTSSAFSSAATVIINAGASQVYYNVGTDAVVEELIKPVVQGAPVAVDTTGSVSAAAILGGIVTSSTAAAVAGTIPTGTVMDASAQFGVGDSVDWSVINTGGANTFTVTAATDHTIVGAAAVVNSTSGRFRTRKTAANTFVTYRLS